jgi:tetratricopeptide (TPR) repeat protein
LDTLLPQAYLIGLVAILLIAAVVVGRQIWRVRRDEATLSRLEQQGEGAPADAASLYELASVQLRKRLYGQAVDNLKRALRKAESGQEPAEALALIQNALGFALAAKPDYPVALNNLAFALEKQGQLEEAISSYRQVLELESGNSTARKRLKRLEGRLPGSPSSSTPGS